jgi:uncharacterized paraquat-inducible protein A
MPLQIECSSCGYQGTIPDSSVGTEIQCPRCHMRLVPLTQDKMENFAAKVLFATQVKKEEVIQPEPEGPEIPFVCPFCGEAYQVSEDLAGKKITCRNCREPCKVDEPTPKKKRVPKASSSWQLVWLCLFLSLVSFLVGFLLGRISKS